MKILLMSMPDVAPLIIHDTAIHMPSHGIASVGGNIDDRHEVYVVDLIRKRRSLVRYLRKLLTRIQPDLVGFSAMAWQYDTCVKLIKFAKQTLPHVKVVIGGYHATLMCEEIADSPESKWIDFIVRGEGEDVCRRLANTLDGTDNVADIPSLSYKKEGRFIHNERGGNVDLATLKLPIRDKRRLTWGYHVFYSKIEVMETSRGCTRTCNFCSMKHMYGRSFRAFPMARILADLDDIYYKRKSRWAFVADDNLVLDPHRVIDICDAIIAKNYKGLNLVSQADCITMSRNEDMVKKMAEAGFKSLFLGIENASKKNLIAANKGDIVDASRKAVAMCHKYGIMVVGGLIFGFPDDDEESIIQNYQFMKDIKADASYCQLLTPYPKTDMRQNLIDEGLVTNKTDYTKYNGLWANVKTRHLTSEQLQYFFWYYRQTVQGWWEPSEHARSGANRIWTAIWIHVFKPLLKFRYKRIMDKCGWEGRYRKDMERIANLNVFSDLNEVVKD